jgi:hypothetical protein
MCSRSWPSRSPITAPTPRLRQRHRRPASRLVPVHRRAAHRRGRIGAGLRQRPLDPPPGRPRPLGDRRRRRAGDARPGPPACPGVAGRARRGGCVRLAARHAATTRCSLPSGSPMCPRHGSRPSGRRSGRPWHRADRSASSTTPTGNALANGSCLSRRRRPSGAGCATAASTGWSRSTTRRPSLPTGLPSSAGRRASTRPAPRCSSGTARRVSDPGRRA